jgi:hypothetical protein
LELKSHVKPDAGNGKWPRLIRVVNHNPLSFLCTTARDFVATRYRSASAASSPPFPSSSMAVSLPTKSALKSFEIVFTKTFA